MIEKSNPNIIPKALSPMDKANAVRQALSDAARRARFSLRARGVYRGDSFELQRGAKAARILLIALFFVLVIIPNTVSILYFGVLASDLYVSEAKFTVGSGIIPKMDGFGSITGVPPAIIIQDTQVVTDYIHSRPMVEDLIKVLDLQKLYSDNKIDWWARFEANESIEKFVRYWDRMTDTSISLPSGMVTLRVKAFTPKDAANIARAVLKLAEDLINDLNSRMWNDTVLAAERDMQVAAKQLAQARGRLEAVRNSQSLLEVGQSSQALSNLMSSLKADLLRAEQEYRLQIRYISENAPQLKVLQSRIIAMKGQLKDLQNEMTLNDRAGELGEATLSGKITKYSEAELDQRIAERRYALSAASVEAARMMSERRLLYLREAVKPALPQEAEYPKRWLLVLLTLCVSFIIWICCVVMISFVRNHMA